MTNRVFLFDALESLYSIMRMRIWIKQKKIKAISKFIEFCNETSNKNISAMTFKNKIILIKNLFLVKGFWISINKLYKKQLDII